MAGRDEEQPPLCVLVCSLSASLVKAVDGGCCITGALDFSAFVYLHLDTHYSGAFMKPPVILCVALNEPE